MQLISVENDEDDDLESNNDEIVDAVSNTHDTAAELSTLSVLLTGDTVQEHMFCKVHAEFLQPDVPLYANANALNGKNGVVLKVERASGLVLFSSSVNKGNIDEEANNTSVWLPAACLLLIVNDQYHSWLAERHGEQQQREQLQKHLLDASSFKYDGDNDSYYQRQLERLQEGSGHRINPQLINKVASAVLE